MTPTLANVPALPTTLAALTVPALPTTQALSAVAKLSWASWSRM
jgi:hypothetical protein